MHLKKKVKRHNFCSWRHQQNFIMQLKLHGRYSHLTRFNNFMRETITTERYSWFGFNNLGLVLGMALYQCDKRVKNKIQKVLTTNSCVWTSCIWENIILR